MTILLILGPSVTYCSDPLGSMKALETAYKEVAAGYIDAAIVGVCSNLLKPTLSILYGSFGLLSSDGLCRAFDQEGNKKKITQIPTSLLPSLQFIAIELLFAN